MWPSTVWLIGNFEWQIKNIYMIDTKPTIPRMWFPILVELLIGQPMNNEHHYSVHLFENSYVRWKWWNKCALTFQYYCSFPKWIIDSVSLITISIISFDFFSVWETTCLTYKYCYVDICQIYIKTHENHEHDWKQFIISHCVWGSKLDINLFFLLS